MVSKTHFPEYVTPLDGRDTFSFACHPGVTCFTDCCRMLELALTPYDVLRLRRATGLTSRELMENYIITEQDPGEPFPRCYLTMVDDGRASCVFVSPEGCTVYPHRPSACRAYPLGRAAVRGGNGSILEHFVIMKEAHCRGFQEAALQTPPQYCIEQDLPAYNTFNDAVAQILQHDMIRQGLIPSRKDIDLFLLALYDLDTFRRMLMEDKAELSSLSAQTKLMPLRYKLESTILSQAEKDALQDDEELLLFSIELLKRQLFGIF